MNLLKKRELVEKTLKVGKNRIIFLAESLPEIKKIVTKADVKDLFEKKVIQIKPVKGRKKIVKRKSQRGFGKIKKKVNRRKEEYVKITRKLRKYVKSLKDREMIDLELYYKLRKKIRMRDFKSKAQMKEYLKNNPDINIKFEEVKKTK